MTDCQAAGPAVAMETILTHFYFGRVGYSSEHHVIHVCAKKKNPHDKPIYKGKNI